MQNKNYEKAGEEAATNFLQVMEDLPTGDNPLTEVESYTYNDQGEIWNGDGIWTGDGGFKTIEPPEQPYAVSIIYNGQLKIFPRLSALQAWAEGKGLNVKELEPTLHFDNKPHERQYGD